MKKNKLINVLPSLIAILIGMLVGTIILVITNPLNALDGLRRLLTGAFNAGLVRGLGNLFYYSTPLIMTGLSVSFAFRTGLFNIGASGQFTVGAFIAIYIAVKWTFIPGWLLWIVALIGALIAGALWGAVVGLFKAYKNVNEVITAIMMNYIAMYLVVFLIKEWDIYNSLTNNTQTPSVFIPAMGLDILLPRSYANGGFLIAIAFVILIWFILNKTTFGYELKAVGFNRHAAKYAGINENRNIIISMMIAGALSGLAGGLTYLASTGRHLDVVETIAPEGFNGIAVALLANNNPLATILSAFFITHINLGGQAMQTIGYVPEIIGMVIGVILYVSSLTLLFKQLMARIRKKQVNVEEGLANE